MDAAGCCECGVHSATSAHVALGIDNNGTWSDAFQFGETDDTSWTLDGATFALDVQLNYYSSPLLSLTSAAGQIIIADPVQRVIYLNVAPATIQNSLTPGTYVYDLLMTVGSVVTPLMHGTVEVVQGVTNVS